MGGGSVTLLHQLQPHHRSLLVEQRRQPGVAVHHVGELDDTDSSCISVYL